MTRMVLGNPPPQVLQKDLKGWITEATPICSAFVYALRMHVTSLHPAVVDMSSDDETTLLSDRNDDFSPILLPPGFQPASIPPNGTMLVPLDPAGQQMIGQDILFKWPTYGWCLGWTSTWNTNHKCKVCKQTVNFTVFFPDDDSSGPHCLCLDNYDTDMDNDSPNHTWLFLQPSTPQPNSIRPWLTTRHVLPHVYTPQTPHVDICLPQLPEESNPVISDLNSQRSINSSISRFSSSQMQPTRVFLLWVFFFSFLFFQKNKCCFAQVVGGGGFCKPWDPRAQEILPSLRTLTNEAERTLDLPR